MSRDFDSRRAASIVRTRGNKWADFRSRDWNPGADRENLSMSRDFEHWNNDPVHTAPPEVEKVFNAEQRHREKRNHLLVVALILIGAALVLACGFFIHDRL